MFLPLIKKPYNIIVQGNFLLGRAFRNSVSYTSTLPKTNSGAYELESL